MSAYGICMACTHVCGCVCGCGCVLCIINGYVDVDVYAYAYADFNVFMYSFLIVRIDFGVYDAIYI